MYTCQAGCRFWGRNPRVLAPGTLAAAIQWGVLEEEPISAPSAETVHNSHPIFFYHEHDQPLQQTLEEEVAFFSLAATPRA